MAHPTPHTSPESKGLHRQDRWQQVVAGGGAAAGVSACIGVRVLGRRAHSVEEGCTVLHLYGGRHRAMRRSDAGRTAVEWACLLRSRLHKCAPPLLPAPVPVCVSMRMRRCMQATACGQSNACEHSLACGTACLTAHPQPSTPPHGHSNCRGFLLGCLTVIGRTSKQQHMQQDPWGCGAPHGLDLCHRHESLLYKLESEV